MNDRPVFDMKEWETALMALIEKKHPQNTPEGDVVTGSHSILGSPEGHQDSETGEGTMDQSGCLQAATPAQSPHNAQEEEVAMDPPLIFRPDEWQDEVNRVHNERVDNAQRRVTVPKEVMPWDDETED